MGLCSPGAEHRVDATAAVSQSCPRHLRIPLGENIPKGELAQAQLVFTPSQRVCKAPSPGRIGCFKLHGAAIKGVLGSPLKGEDRSPALGDSQGTFRADHSTVPATNRHLLNCCPKIEHKAGKYFACSSKSRLLDAADTGALIGGQGWVRGYPPPNHVLPTEALGGDLHLQLGTTAEPPLLRLSHPQPPRPALPHSNYQGLSYRIKY